MNTISLLVGWARTNLTGRWQASFARYFSLLGCWPSGFPINAMQILNPVVGTGVASVWDTVIPMEYGMKENKEYALFTKESVEVPGKGPGESYTGVFGKVHTARWLLVKRP